MKEDILEQLAEDYLQTQGYFTRTNIKYRPIKGCEGFEQKKDSNHSDIDVIGIHPTLAGPKKTYVISCKSWQAGFNFESIINDIEAGKIRSGRDAWKGFRELVIPKWSNAFISKIEEVTGDSQFTYLTVVTKVKGKERALWENYPRFKENLRGNPICLLSFSEMLETISKNMGTTIATSTLGRTMQLLKASGHLS